MDLMETLFWIAVVVLAGGWLLRHLAMFNRRSCPSCRGSGKTRSGVFAERYRTCGRCGGKGEIRGAFGRSE